jgi:hypothetical protein
MLDAWRQSVLEPLLAENAPQFVEAPERPLLINILFPQSEELGPALQILAAALASVYFRCVTQPDWSATSQPAT